jgi:endoglucanase
MNGLLRLCTVTLICFFLFSCSNKEHHDTKKEYTAFRVKRGTNLGEWLSQNEARGEARSKIITRKDIALIDSAGFDHVRLPIDEEQIWDASGKRNEDAVALLKECVSWCNEYGLRVIIDLHILRSHYFNAAEKPLWTVPAEQDKFIALWKDLSAILKEWPNGMLAYELMNEPVADDPEIWNRLIARTVDSIRQWEPERVLVIGSNRWQSANTFDQLKVPAHDPNILLSFHFYEPFYLTHYQASWTPLKDFKGDINYPGQIVLNGGKPDQQRIYNRDTLLKMMQKPIHVADSLKLPLYCGEFGVYYKTSLAAKLAWYKDMVSILDEKGIGYANWNYKSDGFGIVDTNSKPDVPLVKILTGKP